MSYRISYHNVKSGKNHIIVQNLISSCMKNSVQCMFSEKHVRKLTIFLSQAIEFFGELRIWLTTVNWREFLLFHIGGWKQWYFQYLTIWLVERYLNDDVLEENLLFCYSFTGRCTGEAIFNVIRSYLYEKEIDWANSCCVCTDSGKYIYLLYKNRTQWS